MSNVDLMQLFARAMRKWLPHIQKQTYATDGAVTFSNEVVTVRVWWGATRAGAAGEHAVVFNRARVLGRTASNPPAQQRTVKKVCRFRDEVISEVLAARGLK